MKIHRIKMEHGSAKCPDHRPSMHKTTVLELRILLGLPMRATKAEIER